MLRLIFFIIKLSLVIAAAIWLAEQEGAVRAEGFGYIVETQIGVVLAFTLLLCMTVAVLYHGWKMFWQWPEAYRRYHKRRVQEKGIEALTRGFAAVTAGDVRNAKKLAGRAHKLLPDMALATLLMAQAENLAGDTDAARDYYQQLMRDKNAVFFGVRGLLKDFLTNNQQDKALKLIEQADKAQPKTPWLIKTMLELNLRAQDWDKAETTLKKARKIKLFSPIEADEKLRAIYLARSEQAWRVEDFSMSEKMAKKAWKIDVDFIPAILAYAACLAHDGAKSKAQKLILRAWKKQPHHNLAQMWKNLRPYAKSRKAEDDLMVPVRWIEKLAQANKEAALSNYYVGEAYAQAEMWGEAREYLEKAVMQEELYKAVDLLEKVYGHLGDTNKAKNMAARAEKFQPRQWVCHSCNHHSLNWVANCPNCGAFSKMQWRRGHIKNIGAQGNGLSLCADDSVI